ncbi:MAG TPA: energy transducer TonB [Vicinamibacterales bacterium]|nr:energy transducer TonB [Vicinamibacterales bacterium]
MLKRSALTLLLAAAPAVVAGQDNPLAAARELYASARYDEALAVLNGLRPADGAPRSDLRSIEQYRSLCLLALGRGAEAEAAIAAVIAADPMYQPSETEASPRVRAAFSEVRQRQLPEIARERYTAAKEAYDRKAFSESEHRFRELLQLIDDPDMRGRLSDLKVLAQGFLDLSLAAAVPPPPPKAEPAGPPPPTSAPASAPAPNRVYTLEDEAVVAAVAIKQDVPRVPSHIAGQTRDRGVLEIVIDELGRVTQANIRLSIHPMYDTQLLAAARDWRYQPARLNNRPVKFRKVIQISVSR